MNDLDDKGYQFLHQASPDMHASEKIGRVVCYLNQNGAKIPNVPSAKLAAYVMFLADPNYVNDGTLTGNKESLERQISVLTIKQDDIPDSYYELQRRIAREAGHGNVDIDQKAKSDYADVLQSEQRESLLEWNSYLTDSTNTYPMWFRKYAWDGMTKLGLFDKEKQKFSKRTATTAAPYVELNPEALALVYDRIGQYLDGQMPDDETWRGVLSSANFGGLYTAALLETLPLNPERREVTKGSWRKFQQIEGNYQPDYVFGGDGEASDHSPTDNDTVAELTKSLRGMGTGWCTAGTKTASYQLSQGDFYVYYSQDEKNNDTIPRAAIRMENGRVVEVRGIGKSQNLESNMEDIVLGKLRELPGGDKYFKKVDDMKRLTEIDNIIKSDLTAELTAEQLRFLHELDGTIEGFGYQRDPRIAELIKGRNLRTDLSIVLNCSPEQISLSEKEALSGNVIFHYGTLFLNGLTSAKRLTLPQSIEGNLFLNGLTSAKRLTLPQSIKGNLLLNGLTSAEGLTLPQSVGGTLSLNGLTSAEGLTLPQSIGYDLFLNGLTSAQIIALCTKYPQFSGKIF